MQVANATRILTTKGYSILKSALTEAETDAMKAALTVAPKLNTKFATKAMIDASTFKVYRESPKRWYLPRQWGKDTFGAPESNVVPEGEDMPAKSREFVGKPYPYQVEIIDKFIAAGGNGLICVPCGRGKTFMALNTAARLGKRFLVVVDKEFLMNQWKGEMEALMPNLRIGILQENLKQTGREVIPGKAFTIPELKEVARGAGLKLTGSREELVTRLLSAGLATKHPDTVMEYDCCIVMLQTVVQRDFAESEFRDFGFAIFDECHHLGAQHFSRVLQKIQTRWMLGLSATPTREDGLTRVFEWHLGAPVYWEKTRDPDPAVQVKGVFIATEDVGYNTVPTDYRGETVMARLLTNVLACEPRNKEIVRWIRRLCGESPARRVLVLSERIGHLNALEELLKAAEPGLSIGYYIGGMKQEALEESGNNARVLLASYAMASEAMNIKTLNSVILASPRKAVEQSTGRILRVRPEHRELAPIIVDIVDVHSMYRGQWMKRSAYYKRCAYQLEHWEMGAESGRVLRLKVAPTAQANEHGCMISDD